MIQNAVLNAPPYSRRLQSRNASEAFFHARTTERLANMRGTLFDRNTYSDTILMLVLLAITLVSVQLAITILWHRWQFPSMAPSLTHNASPVRSDPYCPSLGALHQEAINEHIETPSLEEENTGTILKGHKDVEFPALQVHRTLGEAHDLDCDFDLAEEDDQENWPREPAECSQNNVGLVRARTWSVPRKPSTIKQTTCRLRRSVTNDPQIQRSGANWTCDEHQDRFSKVRTVEAALLIDSASYGAQNHRLDTFSSHVSNQVKHARPEDNILLCDNVSVHPSRQRHTQNHSSTGMTLVQAGIALACPSYSTAAGKHVSRRRTYHERSVKS